MPLFLLNPISGSFLQKKKFEEGRQSENIPILSPATIAAPHVSYASHLHANGGVASFLSSSPLWNE